MDKESRIKIRELRKQKRYDDIYQEFGAKAYRKYVPRREQKRDLKFLRRQKRYQEVYAKHKKDHFKQILQAEGLGKAVKWWIKDSIKRLGIATGLTATGGAALLSATTESF